MEISILCTFKAGRIGYLISSVDFLTGKVAKGEVISVKKADTKILY
jgi:hypothetical protein